MGEDSDFKLLQDYLGDGSQAAFADVVARHADWIYSMALRIVHDRQMAEDVTQGVFLALSQNAAKIGGRSVQGWLFLATRFVALTALRTKARREKHERQAAMMQNTNLREENTGATQSAPWEQIAPNLEDCVAQLRAKEREAVLLRFYQGKSIAEVGRVLGVSEEAARKRITRSVDKLRALLRRGGVAIPGAELTALFVANATHAAPPALTASCASLTVSAAAKTVSLGVRSMIRTAQLKMAALIGTALILIPSAFAVVVIVHAGAGSAPPAGGVGGAPPAPGQVVPQVIPQAIAPSAPPAAVAATNPDMEGWWADLAETDPKASLALLRFTDEPAKTIAFLRTKLLPLTLTPDRLNGLLDQLGSPDPAVWKPADLELRYFDPRLAVDLQTLMTKVTATPTRQRLIAILSERTSESLANRKIILRKAGQGFNFYSEGFGSWWAEKDVSQLMQYISPKKYWTRAVRAITLLQHIGTPDALAIVNDMAGGNPEALPTQVARDALQQAR